MRMTLHGLLSAGAGALAIVAAAFSAPPLLCQTDQFEPLPLYIVGNFDDEFCSNYETIQEAINNVPPNTPARIQVMQGTYDENINLLGKPIVLYALDGPQFTIIRGNKGVGADTVVTCESGETAQAAIIGFTIKGGDGVLGGGVRFANGAGPAIIGCTIESNDALLGGGIYVNGGDPLILNCTIKSNQADLFGGGIYLENADAQIVHCTIASNQAIDESGGAIRAFDDSDPFIANTILWANSPDQLSPEGTSSPQVHTCTVQGGWFGPGSNNSVADPLFLDLVAGDLRLDLASPCVDTASVAYLPPDTYDLDLDGDTAEATPLDGWLRLRRWEAIVGPFGLPPDKGAHEWTQHNADHDSEKVKRSELGQQLWPVTVDDDTLYLPYSSSHPLSDQDNDIKRLIVVIPSSGRGVYSTLRNVLLPGMDLTGHLEDQTLIVSLQFLSPWDLALGGYGFQAANILDWSEGWNRAEDSEAGEVGDGPNPPLGPFGPRPFQVSSFTVADDVITSIIQSGNFPNIEKVVFTGHSSGGQFTARYALASRVEDEVVRPAGIRMRYVPTSPGEWTFIDEWRPDPDSNVLTDLRNAVWPELISNPVGCAGYNTYREGLDGPFPPYFDGLGADDVARAAAIREQYERREVVILIDRWDADPQGVDLPPGCEALLQGAHRYARAQNFFANVVRYYGPHILGWQRLAIIDSTPPDNNGDGAPDFQHSSKRNWDSRMGRRWLYDADSDPPIAEHTGGRVVRVDQSQPVVAPASRGMTWATAFGDLQDGCLAAAAWGGDVTQIWVANGVYKPSIGLPLPIGAVLRHRSFPIMQGIATLGGFSGWGDAEEQFDFERDPVANLCTLSGDLLNNSAGGFFDDDSFHVVTGHLVGRADYIHTLTLDDPAGPDPPQRFENFTGALDGFTILSGNATSVDDPPPSHSFLTDTYSGGGVFVDRGSPLVQQCTLTMNQAVLGGGAFGLNCPSLMIRDCRIVNNDAAEGGGLGFTSSDAAVIGCRLWDNTAQWGGAMVLFVCQSPRVEGCRVFDNVVTGGGAGLWFLGSQGLVHNTLIDGNVAGHDGGGVLLGGESLPRLAQCTIVRNVVPEEASGSAIFNGGSSLVFVYNCIVSHNVGKGLEIAGNGEVVEHTRADIVYGGTGNIDDPAEFVDADGGDFRLAPGSPCIDAADSDEVAEDTFDFDNDNQVQEAVPIDLDGLPRFHDDPATSNTGGGALPVDMGAFEFQGTSCTADLAPRGGDGVVNVDDLLAVINGWGVCGDPENCPADIAPLGGNGVVNVDDLLAVINAWGGCPG